MKKILTLTVISFIVCAIYLRYKKSESTTSDRNLTAKQPQLISNAKTFFENNVQGTDAGQLLNNLTNTTRAVGGFNKRFLEKLRQQSDNTFFTICY